MYSLTSRTTRHRKCPPPPPPTPRELIQATETIYAGVLVLSVRNRNKLYRKSRSESFPRWIGSELQGEVLMILANFGVPIMLFRCGVTTLGFVIVADVEVGEKGSTNDG